MKGFKVTCLNCGKDQIVKQEDELSSEMGVIEVYPVQGRAIIECNCKNIVDIEC